MPYGRSWPRFLTFIFVSCTAALTGSQIVHEHYKPLADMDELIHRQVEKIKAERGIVDDNLK